MMGDHSLLIGGYNPCLHARNVGADLAGPGRIAGSIQRQPEPGASFHHLGTGGGVVFTDTSRKHERVDATECSGERADLTPDPIDKQCDGFCSGRILRPA